METSKKKVVVFGGNGYVGQAVIHEALSKGLDVISVNRSGAPHGFERPNLPNAGNIDWVKGDLTKPEQWKDRVQGADGAISCVGIIFNSNEAMEKVNGDANMTAIRECKDAGIPRFVYVSSIQLYGNFMRGYFVGKRKAEECLKETYGTNGCSLRPAMVYGTRTVPFAGIHLYVPLWLMGRPMEMVLSTRPFSYIRERLPMTNALLAPPMSRDAIAKFAVAYAVGKIQNNSTGIFTIEEIHQELEKLE